MDRVAVGDGFSSPLVGAVIGQWFRLVALSGSLLFRLHRWLRFHGNWRGGGAVIGQFLLDLSPAGGDDLLVVEFLQPTEIENTSKQILSQKGRQTLRKHYNP